jgi:hypothetical protein
MIAVQALDVCRCRGCGQLLTFDDTCRVPEEQLRGCRSRCDWLLVERAGVRVRVEDAPVSDRYL